MSSIIGLLYRSFSFINSSVQIYLNYIQKQPPEVFHKKGILKNFVIFTGKQLCWGLFFIKIASLQASNSIKKGLQHRYFLVNIGKFLRTPILKNQKQPPEVICRKRYFQLLIKRFWHGCFPVNFAKFLGISFLQNTFGLLLLKNICERLLLHFWKLFCKNILHIII